MEHIIEAVRNPAAGEPAPLYHTKPLLSNLQTTICGLYPKPFYLSSPFPIKPSYKKYPKILKNLQKSLKRFDKYSKTREKGLIFVMFYIGVFCMYFLDPPPNLLGS